MPIYWTLFVISIIMFYLEGALLRPDGRIHSLSKDFYRRERVIALITLLPLLFFLSFRDFVLDTYAYVAAFKYLPDNIESLNNQFANSASGSVFTYIAGLFKIYIIDNHYWWFAFLAFTNIWCIYKVCIKYSPDLALSIYLFIAGATFTWCLNGTRQFLAVTVLFYCSKFLLKDKRWWFIIAVFICSYIHRSAIFLIPVAFIISTNKLYDKWMLLIVLGTLIGAQFSDALMGQAMDIIGKQYTIKENAGANIIRLLFVCVPVAIALIKFKTVEATAPPAIILGLNMSLVGACFMFLATFTSGILVGRMPMYFTIYNLYVLPWLLYNCFGNMRPIVINIFVAVYALWFYVQMCIAWHGLTYVSEALGIYYW